MKTYYEEDDIKISQSRFDEFCIKHQFNRAKIKSIMTRDNIRLVHAIAVPCWEIEYLRATGNPHPLQAIEGRVIVRRIVRENLWPLYERQYGNRVCHSDYKVIAIDGQFHLFSVTIFEKSAFGKPDANLKSIEDQQAGLLAKKLRNITGRGPQKTKALYMSSGLIIYLMNGFISKGDSMFALKSADNAEYIEKITEHNIHQALDTIYKADGKFENCVSLIDLENNCVISLVFLNTESVTNAEKTISSQSACLQHVETR